MMDADNVQAISVLDALHMMKAAWGDVKQSTIANCYRRAGFDIVSSEEEDETTTSPPPEVITHQRASGLIDILRRYLEQQQDSEEHFKHLNLLERYITKKQLSKLDAKQMDIKEFLSKS